MLLAILLLICILLDKARRTLSVRELWRRARDGQDSRVYRLAAYGNSLKLFLWITGSACGAVLLVRLAGISSWLAAGAVVATSWLALGGRPLKTNGFIWETAGFLSVPTAKIVGFLQPVLARAAKLMSDQARSGLYDKDDLLELLQNQIRQTNNRISPEDLRLASGALTFGDKKVREVMTPRRKIKFVPATDSIGPLLMDELHSSGLRYFPVVQSAAKKDSRKVIGTLYLQDVINHHSGGKVRDVMNNRVCTVGETQTLPAALDVCLKNHQYLLLATNGFEEIIGTLNLEDILNQILDQKTAGTDDKYSGLRTVSETEAKKNIRSNSHSRN